MDLLTIYLRDRIRPVGPMSRWDDPEPPPCSYAVFGQACLLRQAHGTPHLIPFEDATIPDLRAREHRGWSVR